MREAKGVLLKRPQHEMRQLNCDCDNEDRWTAFLGMQPSPPEALVACSGCLEIEGGLNLTTHSPVVEESRGRSIPLKDEDPRYQNSDIEKLFYMEARFQHF